MHRFLTNDDVIRVARLGNLLDEQIHHSPQIVVLALKQLRNSEKHLGGRGWRRRHNIAEGPKRNEKRRFFMVARDLLPCHYTISNEQVQYSPQVVVLTLEQLGHSEKPLAGGGCGATKH